MLKSVFTRLRSRNQEREDVATATSVRKLFARQLRGQGIELGALNAPLDVSSAQSIRHLRYVDRYFKNELLELFPELRAVQEQIVETDISCDISEGLTPFADSSLDFVIACHLIEHVSDPIFFLQEVWRVLDDGGRLFLAVPDKDYLAYDSKRPLTTVEHLLSDHARGVRTVEDHHLEEFLTLSEGLVLPENPEHKSAMFEQHRRRSIHIHVWNTRTFCQFLVRFNQDFSPFRMIDVSVPSENERAEMLFILEKAPQGALGNLLHPGRLRLAALADPSSHYTRAR